jgi:short-subunit dehydrogenase
VPSSRPTALVTGASGGIGFEISRHLLGRGFQVIAVARPGKKLDRAVKQLAADGPVTKQPADLARPGAAATLKRALDRKRMTVDILVNNAGFGITGPFVAIGPKQEAELIAVNISALTDLCKLYAPEMVARKSGRILNVASVAAFLPGPLMATYYASKAYVRSFSWALAEELEPMGVSVTVLCPGPTQTGFAGAAGATDTSMFDSKAADAASVARAAVSGLLAGKREVVPGLKYRLGVWLIRLLPTRVAARLALRADS